MPAELKGTAKIKVPDNAKPGDEIEVSATFVAEQEDYERSLRARLAQQDRKHQAALAEVDALHKEELSKLAPADKSAVSAVDQKVQQQMDEMRYLLVKSDLDKRVTEALQSAGLSKIPKAFRNSIELPTDATEDQIKEAVDRLKQDPDLQKILKTEDGATREKPAPKPLGGRGSGGSADEASEAQTQSLLKRLNMNNPKLAEVVKQGNLQGEELAEVLKDWDAKGFLEPSNKK